MYIVHHLYQSRLLHIASRVRMTLTVSDRYVHSPVELKASDAFNWSGLHTPVMVSSVSSTSNSGLLAISQAVLYRPVRGLEPTYHPPITAIAYFPY
jgi:hypothetical protein